MFKLLYKKSKIVYNEIKRGYIWKFMMKMKTHGLQKIDQKQ